MLGHEYKPNNENFDRGAITVVDSLDELPPNIIERIPDLEDAENGYVIKEYNRRWTTPSFTMRDHLLFKKESLFSKEDPLKIKKAATDPSLVQQSAILEKRESELRRYFDNFGLDGLVLKTHRFIARNEDGEFSLYEIQKRLPEGFLHLAAAAYKINLDDMTLENIRKLESNVGKLHRALSSLLDEKKDPTFKHFVPDLNSENIGITKDGDIFLYDTNAMKYRKADNDHFAGNVRNSIIELEALDATLKRHLSDL